MFNPFAPTSQENTSSVDEESASEELLSEEHANQCELNSDIDLSRDDEGIDDSYADGYAPCVEEPVSCDSTENDFATKDDVNRPADTTMEQVFETLHRLETMFAAKIDRSEYELEALKKQSEEIQEYKADLYASILTPVLKPLARTHAFMKRAISKACAGNADSVALDEFEFAFDDLSEVIEDCGVEVRTFEEGSSFEASVMKITGQNKVADPEKNKTVSSASTDAYVFKDTVLEKARTIVNVYSEEQSSSAQDV